MDPLTREVAQFAFIACDGQTSEDLIPFSRKYSDRVGEQRKYDARKTTQNTESDCSTAAGADSAPPHHAETAFECDSSAENTDVPDIARVIGHGSVVSDTISTPFATTRLRALWDFSSMAETEVYRDSAQIYIGTWISGVRISSERAGRHGLARAFTAKRRLVLTNRRTHVYVGIRCREFVLPTEPPRPRLFRGFGICAVRRFWVHFILECSKNHAHIKIDGLRLVDGGAGNTI